ncbi:MAG TPA: HAMP domain-containing sensor histidine kinase [Candidatus Dormibacteraeota bacterium]|nr:HAMP domain-containing sensor histidine kinase [Candidatus Dormibacteraeota bacterium]
MSPTGPAPGTSGPLPAGADQLLSCLTELGSDAVLVLSPARNLIWASANAAALLAGPQLGEGTQRQPPVGLGSPLSQLLDDPRAADVVGRVLATGAIARGELRQNDWRRILKAVAAPLVLSDGSLQVVLILTDITSERRLSRAHQELIANLSHDLRTPLASLRLMAETLTGEARGDAPATQLFATRIAQEAERLHTLVAGILDLSRLEAGVERAQIGPVDLWQVASQAVEEVRPQAKERQLTLTLRGTPTTALADSARLERALINVLDNALKFTVSPGAVTVTVGVATGRPTVSVRDTGSGIPASQLPRIFDRFYTGDRSRAGRSSGLGLTIAKQAVELQGGEIKVRSTPGQGTLVRIVLGQP